MQKIGWILLIIAAVGDFAVPYVLALYYKGYRHKKHVMSYLGNPKSPVKNLYNTWLVLLGMFLCISTKNIFDLYNPLSHWLTVVLITLMTVFAVGAGILAGIFSVNELNEMRTISSMIHGIGSALGFMAMLFCPLVISILSLKQSFYTIGIICAICFILTLLFFVLFILSDKEKYKKSMIDNTGLWQRLTLLFMYIPFVLIAISSL